MMDKAEKRIRKMKARYDVNSQLIAQQKRDLRRWGGLMIGKVEIIDHKNAEAERARQLGPRCRCGHLVEDHGYSNGDSHADETNSNGVCGCVFDQNEAMYSREMAEIQMKIFEEDDENTS